MVLIMAGLSALLLLTLAAPAPASPDARFGSMWTDWTRVAREAEAAETARGHAQKPAPTVEAVTLGNRVGEIVASGDCEEGERVALAAGDVALARAVRAYCKAAPVDR